MKGKPMNRETIKLAVQIVAAAIPMQAGTWIANPDKVTAFIEAVAAKLYDLEQGE